MSFQEVKDDNVEATSFPVQDEDEVQLQNLGYKQQLHRTWHLAENFAASFCSLNFIGSTRTLFFLGLLAGGPAAVWSSYVVTIIFMMITAGILAEVSSVLPISSSICIWAAVSAWPKYARLFGFIVAWWACTAWITITTAIIQSAAGFVGSQLVVWEIEFPGGIDSNNIKWRVVIWMLSEIFLLFAVAINYIPPRFYSPFLRFSTFLIMLDFFLTLIWLPIGVSRTYGFRSVRDVFTKTYNGTGAPPVWNWMLSFLYSSTAMMGFDASGHVAEETKNARITAGKGMLTSALATCVLGFVTTILFLFCAPDLDTLFSLQAPQPFVLIYALSVGKRASVVLTIVAVLGLLVDASVCIVSASRLIFAVARDGVLPMSEWVAQVNSAGQPKNAINVVYVVAATVLCTLLPSQVAFFSLVSASTLLLIGSYGLICLLRLTMTPNSFKSSYFYLGRFRKLFYFSSVLWNIFLLAISISPFFFPVTVSTFNFACVIFVVSTLCGILSWYFIPTERWRFREQVLQELQAKDT